jgi:mannose-6-phosphate isomerase-like protein (cupin superfamily)
MFGVQSTGVVVGPPSRATDWHEAALDSGGAVEALSVAALKDIADGLAKVQRSVLPVPGSGDEPRSLRLISTAAYDVWLVTWPPSGSMKDHHHGDSVGVMRVVAGRLVEQFGTEVRSVLRDRSVVTGPHCTHRLWNPWTDECTTVHVYSPPLQTMTYWSTLEARSLHPSGAAIEPSLRPVTDRPAEASSAT